MAGPQRQKPFLAHSALRLSDGIDCWFHRVTSISKSVIQSIGAATLKAAAPSPVCSVRCWKYRAL
jgi:hypothetical protein